MLYPRQTKDINIFVEWADAKQLSQVFLFKEWLVSLLAQLSDYFLGTLFCRRPDLLCLDKIPRNV
jgi:hypothetical protein